MRRRTRRSRLDRNKGSVGDAAATPYDFLEDDFFEEDLRPEDCFDADFLPDDFFFGTLPPARRASDSPIVNGQPLWPDDRLKASAVTFRLGGTYELAERFRAIAHIGRGFRALALLPHAFDALVSARGARTATRRAQVSPGFGGFSVGF